MKAPSFEQFCNTWERIRSGNFDSQNDVKINFGSVSIQWDGEKQGGRLFDPFRQIDKTVYLNASGWSHWTHEG